MQKRAELIHSRSCAGPLQFRAGKTLVSNIWDLVYFDTIIIEPAAVKINLSDVLANFLNLDNNITHRRFVSGFKNNNKLPKIAQVDINCWWFLCAYSHVVLDS